MRWRWRLLSWVIVASLSALLTTSLWLYHYYTAEGPLTEETHIVIPRGAGVVDIAAMLHDQGIVHNPYAFLAVSGLYTREHILKAGEYAFLPGASPSDILDKMARGDTFLRKFTIPEGLTVKQIKAIMEKADGLTGAFPDPVAEGSLMPDTYYYSLGESRAEKVVKMQKAMQEYLQNAWENRAADLPLTSPDQAIILASIVEKETGVPEERSRIAAVFTNRLRKGMKLQTDPTIIYGITNGSNNLGRALLLRDLQTPHPYNTYLNEGLPPGPIANPGRAAIDAALSPLQSDELFFVSTGSGAHRFAATLDEHNKNVSMLREVQRQRQEPVTPPTGELPLPNDAQKPKEDAVPSPAPAEQPAPPAAEPPAAAAPAPAQEPPSPTVPEAAAPAGESPPQP